MNEAMVFVAWADDEIAWIVVGAVLVKMMDASAFR
jgi:hypothetical protein